MGSLLWDGLQQCR